MAILIKIPGNDTLHKYVVANTEQRDIYLTLIAQGRIAQDTTGRYPDPALIFEGINIDSAHVAEEIQVPSLTVVSADIDDKAEPRASEFDLIRSAYVFFGNLQDFRDDLARENKTDSLAYVNATITALKQFLKRAPTL